MASDLPLIRPLVAGDAPACDAVTASLPYHFGNEDGRRECAEAVRSQAGLVAVEGDRVVGELPGLWPGDQALLLAMPLG